MVQIVRIYMNSGQLKKSARYRITENAPRFSWAAKATHQNAVQKAYSLQVRSDDALLWDTGWVETQAQEVCYTGKPLPTEQKLYVRVAVRDDLGDESAPVEESFYLSGLEEQPLGWIAASDDQPGKAVYFRKEFTLTGEVKRAVMYVCGLGYHQLYINGNRLDELVLDPLHSDYTKSCYYTMLPELASSLLAGENCLGVVLGDGWRRNEVILRRRGKNIHKARFMGIPQLSLSLRIEYTDGRKEVIGTDESWGWTHGAIVENNLFDGETYDARLRLPGWNLPGACDVPFEKVALVDAPGGKPRVATVEPITEHESIAPKTITMVDSNTCIIDFGANIAGYCRLRLPSNMEHGQIITATHSEMLDDDGRLFMNTLRTAKATDTYIACGDERDLTYWQPLFNYHGFRYVQITGWPLITKDDVVAVTIHTDIKNGSFFTCGNALVNAIQDVILRTEKDNLMGILTDCPQRDERAAWMNDTTVRFEETPYNFDISRLFPKVIQDLLDVQNPDGSITCTAPFVFGTRPADPVCSAFLVAGLEAVMHTGNMALLQEAYDHFAGWEECLSTRAEDYIIKYSHYGDWAAPVYACPAEEDRRSAVTPGIFMSTGYYYYNAALLARFADMLGRAEDKRRFEELAENIRQAMLKTWWNEETGQMATGSQGCQSFALWLNILPENKRALAAQRLHEDLVANDYRFTTGNLTTRYLFDALTEYGYLEDAWKLIARDTYPSFGYMLQNEATTLWERFELKNSGAVYSHNHPMYGAVGYWFYAYLAGIKLVKPGAAEVDIHPYFPKDLLSANALLETARGDIVVRWVKRFGKTVLHVTVPMGVKANIYFAGQHHTVGSGFWTYEVEGDVAGDCAPC